MEKLMLRPKEAAELLGLGRTRFYQLVRAGTVPSCHIGKAIRIPVAALKEWAEAQASQQPILTKSA